MPNNIVKGSSALDASYVCLIRGSSLVSFDLKAPRLLIYN